MEGMESVLEFIYEEELGEEETLDEDRLEDVEMLDAETLDGDDRSPIREATKPTEHGNGGDEAAEHEIRGRNQRRRASKKKNKNKRKKKSGSPLNITDINRFVIDTCRHLKEKKSYLVWNAVGCLGVSAVSELVKEVDIIQGCGGQKTADSKRSRTGGGILWNILKTREPRAYKEIMAKGREFEKQFRKPKSKQLTEGNEETNSQSAKIHEGEAVAEELDSSGQMPKVQQGTETSDPNTGRISVLNRIRVPVAYDDLFEEEQKEMVRSFERKHAQQSLLWRGIFAVFLLSFAVFFIYSIFGQVRFHGSCAIMLTSVVDSHCCRLPKFGWDNKMGTVWPFKMGALSEDILI